MNSKNGSTLGKYPAKNTGLLLSETFKDPLSYHTKGADHYRYASSSKTFKAAVTRG